RRSVAGHCADDSGSVHLADDIVVIVRNEQVALRIERDALMTVEWRIHGGAERGTAIAGKAKHAVAGYGRHRAGRIHSPNQETSRFRKIDTACIVGYDAEWLKQPAGLCGSVRRA